MCLSKTYNPRKTDESQPVGEEGDLWCPWNGDTRDHRHKLQWFCHLFHPVQETECVRLSDPYQYRNLAENFLECSIQKWEFSSDHFLVNHGHKANCSCSKEAAWKNRLLHSSHTKKIIKVSGHKSASPLNQAPIYMYIYMSGVWLGVDLLRTETKKASCE